MVLSTLRNSPQRTLLKSIRASHAILSSSRKRSTTTTTTPTKRTPAAANESFAFDTSLDLNALTEEDLLAIDNAVKVQLNVDSAAVTPHPLPASPLLPVIEALASVVEAPHAEAIIPAPVTTVPLPVKRPQNKGKKKAWEDRSLMEKFRPSGVLSVSDLVAPTWCEVQYDYGLRQRRSRPVNQRPKSFKTSTGKEITVEVKVAAKNDCPDEARAGAVHKELEREIRGEEIRIETRSDEERWGLRLLNMIACFNILIEEGLTREMPVFGMTNGAIIIGIIDEILKVELPAESPGKRRMSHTTPRKSPKRAKRTPPPNQREIEDFFPPSPKKPAKVNQRANSSSPTRSVNGISTTPTSPRYTLRVSDTKTRVTDTMPPEADTRGPQLQVMLYRRLLSALTSTTEPFDFPALWDQLGVDPQAEFSTLFLVQAGLLEHNEGFKTTNLDGLVCNWERVVREAEKRGVRGVG
ncbi:exonuclease V a 5' deoxyribonuclease-domain-containing protein [Ephemerocybe angulata]|uniref:Exonuclease V a 5' deoxyribonuclease-domain-containing protein n=1 Tax=Ephemerocybe angulata TaxID=980116 RepID=A0A8H6IL84_9AGAR|nr:exonuclease V a 5' deoxyribonuclease-domain-containing protein [Tulosesus angulatus]